MPQDTQETPVLTADRVGTIFADSLFKEGEPTEGYVPAQGVIHNVGFHPARVAGHKAEIGAMLAELPDDFMRTGGGGMSFLSACYDRHGNQWTGLHMTMEKLFQLGIATGQAEWLMPREMWGILPGGMPYAVVDVAA